MAASPAPKAGRLDRLLNPRSLAFIGGEAAEEAIEQCRRMNFAGEMWAVHPSRSELGDISTVSTVAELAEPPDAAFVAVNRSATITTVRELRSLGAGAAVCLASGFAEVGDEGAALQAELVSAADGMPVIGPNCYGTVSGTTGAVLWPDQQGLNRCERGVAFVTQSGNIAVNLTMQQRALDVAHVLTLGNQADVSIEEALEALAVDASVSAVGLHIETLSDIERFAAAVATARSRNVHVVALKTGSSAQGGCDRGLAHVVAGRKRRCLLRLVRSHRRETGALDPRAPRHFARDHHNWTAPREPSRIAQLQWWGGVPRGRPRRGL